MEYNELIQKRRSIRKYKPDPVDDETILRLLEAARVAPSWEDKQCWQFIVIKSPETRAALGEAFAEGNPGKKSLNAAPVVIVCCGDPSKSGIMGDRHYYMMDTGIAMEHLILAAANEGLGTCWLGLFDEDKVKQVLGIPKEWRVTAMSPLGVPDQDPKPRPRKELHEIVYAEKWGSAYIKPKE